MTDATTIGVSGDARYDITVGRGILSTLGEALPPAARKVLVIHPPTLAAQAERLRAQLIGKDDEEARTTDVSRRRRLAGAQQEDQQAEATGHLPN